MANIVSGVSSASMSPAVCDHRRAVETACAEFKIGDEFSMDELTGLVGKLDNLDTDECWCYLDASKSKILLLDATLKGSYYTNMCSHGTFIIENTASVDLEMICVQSLAGYMMSDEEFSKKLKEGTLKNRLHSVAFWIWGKYVNKQNDMPFRNRNDPSRPYVSFE